MMQFLKKFILQNNDLINHAYIEKFFIILKYK